MRWCKGEALVLKLVSVFPLHIYHLTVFFTLSVFDMLRTGVNTWYASHATNLHSLIVYRNYPQTIIHLEHITLNEILLGLSAHTRLHPVFFVSIFNSIFNTKYLRSISILCRSQWSISPEVEENSSSLRRLDPLLLFTPSFLSRQKIPSPFLISKSPSSTPFPSQPLGEEWLEEGGHWSLPSLESREESEGWISTSSSYFTCT